MAIAVIGARGQLGLAFCAQLGSEAVALSHAEVELRDRGSLERSLQLISPKAVINAAAYNFVDEAESRPADAFAVNAFGVRELSLVCRDLGCLLVHFSSDYVFGLDREHRLPYEESAAPGPLSVYGASKLAGEYFVRTNCPRHFVVRTCGLYGLRGSGGKGRNFVDTMLRLAREHRPIRVVHDQTCTPTYATDLAEACLALMSTEAFGLYHWTSAGYCTWYEFACEIFRQSGISVECSPINTHEYAARAERPGYSVLSTEKFAQLGFDSPRHWKEALRDYLAARADAGAKS